MSVSTKNFPEWVTQAGRSIVKSDSRQINKYTYLRFGQLFILNANFLGLNTFYALDEQHYPLKMAQGQGLQKPEKYL